MKSPALPMLFIVAVVALFLCLPSLASSHQLSGNPGDAYVFGADSAVDPFGYSQYYPVLTSAGGRTYAIWQDNRPVEGLQNFSRIFYRDITDLSPGPRSWRRDLRHIYTCIMRNIFNREK